MSLKLCLAFLFWGIGVLVGFGKDVRCTEWLTPLHSFAEAQATYINPDMDIVKRLDNILTESKMGVVAHYYMDVELQGVLQALNFEHVFIADSLAMGDAAVRMCEKGCTSISVLGVDFMAESVRAIMQKSGWGHIPVYRSVEKSIGCSLAESAERLVYGAWLEKASKATNPLHVVYINTSLETKSKSSSIVPTITCTSSNVVQTMLQAAIDIGPELTVWYGPDTEMGHNLQTMFDRILENWDDAQIKSLHPMHDHASISTLRENLNVFPNGKCVVHQVFNEGVVETLKESYPNAYMSAHLEVPGDMFQVAMEASLTDDGVVGSTSDILNFITKKVKQVATNTCKNAAKTAGISKEGKTRLQFILGTEAGMVTSIVKNVQSILRETGMGEKVEAEIVFPVAAEAVTSDGDGGIVPGVSGSEGCSTAGGCATCPFMKMNDLDALVDLAETVAEGKHEMLVGHAPPDRLKGDEIEMGIKPILHMRHLMKENRFDPKLVSEVLEFRK